MANRRAEWVGVVVTGVLMALAAFGCMVYRANTVKTAYVPDGIPYAPAFRGGHTGPAVMLNSHDGQAFGSLALDPWLGHPERWPGGRPEMSYRAARPVLVWLAAATSNGSKTAVEWSLLAWTAAGIGLLGAGARMLARRWNRNARGVPLLLLLPAVIMQMLFGGLSDGMAVGLALVGMAWWLDGRDRWAIAALCIAALTKESTLIVVLALLVTADRRRARWLLLPMAAYASWLVVVRLRVGMWPTAGHPDGLGFPPGNLINGLRSWTITEVLCAASIVALAAVAWHRAPGPEVRWLVALSGLFALTMGPAVLQGWDFTRPLLPITVIGACLLARRCGEFDDVVPDAGTAPLDVTGPVLVAAALP